MNIKTPVEVLEELGIKPSSEHCARTNCGELVKWMPSLVLYDSAGAQIATVAIELGLCGGHASEVEVDDVLDNAGWEYICKSAFDERALERPDRGRTRIAIYKV